MHVPGKQKIAADGFSRYKQGAILAQIFTEEVNHNDLCDTMHKQDARYNIELLTHQTMTDNHRTHKSSSEAAVAVLKAGPSVITWEILKTSTSEDAVLVKVMEQVGKGFPDSSYQVHPSVQPYHKYRN